MQPNKSTVKSVIKLKSTQIFIVAGTVLMTMAISLICIGLTVRYEVITDTVDAGSIPYWSMDLPPEQEEWFQRGIEDLRLTSKGTQFEHGKVKNVLVFLADGVTTDMLAGARFGEQANVKDFIWDSFPHLGVLKSSCGFMYDCDIFTIGTALFGGVQTQPGLGGLDKRVEWQNCSQANEKKFQVRSILEQAQDANLRTGFVTTKRITSAPLSALYAHISDTKWECDASMPKEKLLNNECQDVATQLMTGQTGQQLNVIMGGGAQTLVSRPPNDTDVDASACDSKDKRNLLQDWKSLKIETGSNFKMLETSKDLQRFNGATRDFVTGIFANGNLVHREPGLKKLVSKSIEVLTRPDVGYVLVAETKAEGSSIRAFQDTLVELNETIAETIGDESFSIDDTLILVAFMDFTKPSKGPVVPGDILLFAKGPNSHLFHSIHEMTYLAHVVSYSLKIGPFRVANKLQKRTHSND